MKEITTQEFVGKEYVRTVYAMQVNEDFKLVVKENGKIVSSVGGKAGDYILLDSDNQYYVARKDIFEQFHEVTK